MPLIAKKVNISIINKPNIIDLPRAAPTPGITPTPKSRKKIPAANQIKTAATNAPITMRSRQPPSFGGADPAPRASGVGCVQLAGG